MKTCIKCQHPSEDFPPNKRTRDGLGSWCRSCCRENDKLRRPTGSEQVKARSKAYRERNRVQLRAKQRVRLAETAALKSSPCHGCRGTFPSWCMDFDHVRGEKSRGIGRMVGGSTTTILAEVAKCDLVCACCHRVRTSARKAGQDVAPRRKLFLERINKLKARPCQDCGQFFPPEAMDFDHVRGEKIIRVSSMTTWAWERVLQEVGKCDLVCANCHRTRTQDRIKKVA